jgi:hypothetical protein
MEMGLGNVLVSRLLESVIKVSPEAHDSSILVICANLNDSKLEWVRTGETRERHY